MWIEPKEENVFSFDSPSMPKIVSFDHEGTLIKELKFEKSVDELIYQFRNDPDVLGRTWAMNELVRLSSGTSVDERARIEDALAKGAAAEKFAGLRRLAIEVLAASEQGAEEKTSYRPAVLEMLNVLAGDSNTTVKAAALLRLGGLGDAKYADLFISNLNAQSYPVLEAAASGLGALKDPKHFAALAKLAETAGWRNRVQVVGLKALASLGDKRAIPLGLKFSAKGNPANVRSAASLVLASTGKGNPKIYPILFASFKESLDTENIQAVVDILQSFIVLGDPRAQEAFDLLKERFKDQPMFLGFLSQFEERFKKAVENK